ncbi:tetratricopeptide repeat-containing sensor histidine kinase [Winogradskyella sp.]|uniref:tetratricopeptide repeat-containing sensor histidine kinase n=1 Tax=Winogradskyella sp. TaxID=1883156 RepID=UPI003BAD841C
MKKLIILTIVIFIALSAASQSKNQKHIDSLRQVYLKKKDPLIKYSVYYDIGRHFMSINLDSSIAIFKRVNLQALSIDNDTLQAKALIGLGLAFSDKSMLDSAQVYYDKAAKVVARTSHDDLKSSLFNNRGILFFYQSDYTSARREFEMVLQIAKAADDLEGVSRSYNNLALCDSYNGDYEGALEMYLESAKIAEQLNDRLALAKCYNNIGLLYRDIEDYDKSEDYLLKSLDIKQEEGSKIDIIGSYLNLGGTFRKIGIAKKDTTRLLKAKDYYEKALQLSNESNYINGRNNTYVNLALIETTLGNYKKGIDYGKKSLENSINKGDTHGELVSRINLGDAYRYDKQFGLAEEQLLKGYEMAKTAKNLYIQKEASLIMSLLNSDQNRYKLALDYYKDYFDLTDSISSTEVKNKVNELETKYETEKKEKQILIQRATLAEQDLVIQKRNSQLVGLGGLLLILGLVGYLFYNQQRLKNQQLQKENELKDALLKIETQNKLQEQRLRISRDLHDNIGAQLTFIISSLDNLKYAFDIKDKKLNTKLATISQFTSGTIYELRDTIWAMNKSEISFEDLQTRISNYIDKAHLYDSNIQFSFTVNDNVDVSKKFTSVEGMNIHRIIQEAIHNSLKYAKASEVKVEVYKMVSNHVFRISDNGKGFDLNKTKRGNGLSNMEKRTTEINGNLKIESVLNEGTIIELSV